ncbi:hypothetical protein [Leekyejoonella antrihumi]|uniref:DUF4352 domain-containing protein n=1 Tax=Leekyejoonella antrihumi TaxID=1660198 RepID=A0A563DVQ8_9MICO|nr:hypothetical protein [Leekyejoonella antrihumi]TWP34297.1 hypothetical protein FGL98_17840 [Leekyejoonella antrihumi]
MTTSAYRRIAGASIAMIGVLGLAACNNETVSATPPATSVPSSSSSQAPNQSQSQTTTSQAPETTQDAPSTSSSSSSSSAAAGTGSYTGPTQVTAANAKMTFGKGAVIKDGDDLYNLKVKDLKVAPNSVYADANLNKANGIVYYIDFDVTSIKQNKTFFGTNSVNGLFLYPTFKSGAKAKRLYGDAPGCKSTSDKLTVGQTGSSCYVYQITGAKATTVTYNDYSHNITWSK